MSQCLSKDCSRLFPHLLLFQSKTLAKTADTIIINYTWNNIDWKKQKMWEETLMSGQGGTSLAQQGQLETRQDVKGLLQSHLWCLKDLARLMDRLDYTFYSRYN